MKSIIKDKVPKMRRSSTHILMYPACQRRIHACHKPKWNSSFRLVFTVEFLFESSYHLLFLGMAYQQTYISDWPICIGKKSIWCLICNERVTAIPGNMPGAVRDREHLSLEVPLGTPLPGSTSGNTSPGNCLLGSPSGNTSPRNCLRGSRSWSRSTPEVVPGQGHLLPGVFPLPSHLFPGIAVTRNEL